MFHQLLTAIAARVVVRRLTVVALSRSQDISRFFRSLRTYAGSISCHENIFHADTAFIGQSSRDTDLFTQHTGTEVSGGRREHVYVGPNFLYSGPHSIPATRSAQAAFCAIGGSWILPSSRSGKTARTSANVLESLWLQNAWFLDMDSQTLPLPQLRMLFATFFRLRSGFTELRQMNLIVTHLKAANLEVLNLYFPFPSLSRINELQRQSLAEQWRFLIERTPKLRALKLHSHLPDSLGILGEDPYVSQGLTKLFLSGDNLPSTFLDAIRPQNMPALRFLDVSGTAYDASHEVARRTEWEAGWRTAKIDCPEPPKMSAFEK
jgi:hypothetical protein